MDEKHLKIRISTLAKYAKEMRSTQKDYFKHAKSSDQMTKNTLLKYAKAAEQRFDSFLKQLEMEGLV